MFVAPVYCLTKYRTQLQATLVMACVLVAHSNSRAAQEINVLIDGEITGIEELGSVAELLPSELAIGAPARITISLSDATFPAGASTIGGFQSPGQSKVLSPVDILLVVDDQKTLRDDTASIVLSHDPSGTQGEPLAIAEILQFQSGGPEGLDGLEWRIAGGFSTEGDRLSDGELLSDPTTWNTFEKRALEIVLSSPGSQGQYRVQMEFGEAIVVPEPTMAAYLVGLLCFRAAIRSRYPGAISKRAADGHAKLKGRSSPDGCEHGAPLPGFAPRHSRLRTSTGTRSALR